MTVNAQLHVLAAATCTTPAAFCPTHSATFTAAVFPPTDLFNRSVRARAVSLVQTASTSSSSSSERVSPAAAELAVTVVSVAEAPSSNQQGQAVLVVPGTGLSSRAVKAALSGPQVQTVLQDSWVTIATDAMTQRGSSSSSNKMRRSLLQEQQQPVAAAAAAAARRSARRSRHRPSPSPPPSPSPQPTAAAVNCSGHFTAWQPCGLNHAPMWQACMTYTTYVIDVPAANGGARCPRRTGFKSWKACNPSECGLGPVPPPGVLPVVALNATERAIWAMQRVGEFNSTDRTVVDISAAMQQEKNKGLIAVVIDTGIDSGHPELNVIGFKDMRDEPGSLWYNKDGNGCVLTEIKSSYPRCVHV